ncbi:Cupredoxin superfamily protein isoform 1 [Dorcoceras hygrometricum]|uniref:Cupredoxin superfamily protein isoform 1 n=1 Tax=Dorcoceras hygrometricum TaxID=472368 RepID=A0A2Z7ACB0_9LAMI|nr:Cupredoxin superfamily protein isoform 1 [Dorcoceras hygrometricum]
MVKRLETSSHDPLGITDSACKNHSVMVSVQYGPFNTYIPIRSTIIGKSRVARDPIYLGDQIVTSRVLLDSIGYPRMKASGESSTTKNRLLHASGPYPIPPPNDPKSELNTVSATLNQKLQETEMAPFAPRIRAAAAIHMKQIVLDNQSRTILDEMAPFAPRIRAAAAIHMKQIVLDNQSRTILDVLEPN